MASAHNRKRALVIIRWVMIPFIIFMNILVFGTCIFSSIGLFIKTFLCTGIYLFISNILFEWIAKVYGKRFPLPGDMFRKIIYILPVFYLLTSLFIAGLFYGYNLPGIVECTARHTMLYWTVLYGCSFTTLFAFISIGAINWEAWKASVSETEKLKNIYQRSKILGLKGQINPHFLFNCFNTLSGLIQEDESRAEKFLNEMTKVHRYLLRSDDELLVLLETELKFAESYLYLAKGRFGESIKISIDIDSAILQKMLPPLSMQVILENIIYTNAMDKHDPLTISIKNNLDSNIEITNSVRQKVVLQNLHVDDGLDNLLNKYKILNGGEISIIETGETRTLELPLFAKKEALS
jgi:two-component system, LytTR family, sensor kinase